MTLRFVCSNLLYLDLAAMDLSWSCRRRKASTPRRSQGVLAFLRVQLQFNVDEEEGKYTEAQPRCTCPSSESTLHWSLMSTEYNFRALLMRRRQVQRGAAELYLSSYRINNAEESVVDYRVQLRLRHTRVVCGTRSLYFSPNNRFVSLVFICLYKAYREIKVSFTMAHLFVMKVARLRDRIREECAMYIIMLSVVTLDEQRDDQILGHTENKKHLLVQQGLR